MLFGFPGAVYPVARRGNARRKIYRYETVSRTVKTNDIAAMLARAGTDPLGNTPREAMEFLKVETARWGKVIKRAGIRIEQRAFPA